MNSRDAGPVCPLGDDGLGAPPRPALAGRQAAAGVTWAPQKKMANEGVSVMEQQDCEALRTRLERVEQRLSITASALLVAMILVVVLAAERPAASQQVSGLLRTRGLEVVDDTGRPRITLSAFLGDPEVNILDEAGNIRFHLTPGLLTFKDRQQDRIVLVISGSVTTFGLTGGPTNNQFIGLVTGGPDSPAIAITDTASRRVLFRAP